MITFVKQVYITDFIPIKAERKIPLPLKEIEETDTLTLLLKTGNYKRTFRYMFETGHPIPLKIVPKLLGVLSRRRLSFYSLVDLKLSIFVVSNKTRNQITRLLICPQGSHRIFLGTFNPISTGLFCLVVALGGGVFSTPLP